MPPRRAPTHFLCIPLVTASSRRQLGSSLSSFRADATSPDSFGLPEQAIRPLGTLHLTLGVMSFPKEEQDNGGLENAVALLKTLAPRQILAEASTRKVTSTGVSSTPQPPATDGDGNSGGGPLLSLTLKGLHAMQAPSRASVLYAAPGDDEDGRLLGFCQDLRSRFLDAGLMTDDGRPLLLHATIVNTIYVKGRGGGRGGGRRGDKLTVDARGILDRYGDFVWMQDVPVEKIAICRMGAKKLGDDGDEAYEVEAEIDVI
jgi:activating signal cointegrator complex subunit 1